MLGPFSQIFAVLFPMPTKWSQPPECDIKSLKWSRQNLRLISPCFLAAPSLSTVPNAWPPLHLFLQVCMLKSCSFFKAYLIRCLLHKTFLISPSHLNKWLLHFCACENMHTHTHTQFLKCLTSVVYYFLFLFSIINSFSTESCYIHQYIPY